MPAAPLKMRGKKKGYDRREKRLVSGAASSLEGEKKKPALYYLHLITKKGSKDRSDFSKDRERTASLPPVGGRRGETNDYGLKSEFKFFLEG